jgi:recombination protein RecT
MAKVGEAKELAKQSKIVTVYDFMEQKKDLIQKALPATITPDRLIGLFTMIMKSSPELGQCSQTSLIGAVIQTVQLGLNPGAVGHVHLVPFNNKKKVGNTWRSEREVQLIVGYKGMVELVNRCGKAVILSTEVVYENDEFKCEYGLNPILQHKPITDGPRDGIRGVYCVAKNLVANEKVFVYLSKADIDKVKDSSKAAQSDYSPWNKWYEEMAKKTAIKRICKILPLSVEAQAQIGADESIKNQIQPNMTEARNEANWDTINVDPASGVDSSPEIQPEPSEEQPGLSPETMPSEVEQSQESEPTENSEYDASEDHRPITEAQIKRLLAIAKSNGYSTEDVDGYLGTLGIESKKNIKRSEYEEIVDQFSEKK